MAKHQTVAKNVKEISKEAVENRLQKMLEIKREYLERIARESWDEVAKEMKLQQGNSKTGQNVRTISLIPIHDCVNCSGCSRLCYDLRNDCIYPSVLNDRARNSALRQTNPEKYWIKVAELVAQEFVTELRINVGGDLRSEDFLFINKWVAKANPKTDILFFTKNYKGINEYLDNNTFESNIHPIMSAWLGMEMDNPHNLPCSHVLWADGKTTAPEFGAYYCGGNCSACHFKSEGCWTLKNGESVIFMAH